LKEPELLGVRLDFPDGVGCVKLPLDQRTVSSWGALEEQLMELPVFLVDLVYDSLE